MADIFISYARADSHQARRLADQFEARGWTVFWDHTIPAGKTWRDVIGGELDEARCVIVAWSQSSIKSQWVLDEAEVGKARDILVPILVETVQAPLGFGQIQAANLTAWDGDPTSEDFEQLVRAVAGVLGEPCGAQAEETEVKRAVQDIPKRKRQRPRISLAVAVPVTLAVIAFSYFFVLRPWTQAPTERGDPPRPAAATPGAGQPEVLLKPSNLMLVIGKREANDRELGPLFFNITCQLANKTAKPVRIRRLEAKVTRPGEPALAFSWDLFFETLPDSGQMRRLDRSAGIELSPGSSKKLGVQFRGNAFHPDNIWTPADYEFQMLGWADREPGEQKANIKTQFRVRISNQHAREVRYWLKAADDTWAALNDPDNAVAIPVQMREVKIGL